MCVDVSLLLVHLHVDKFQGTGSLKVNVLRDFKSLSGVDFPFQRYLEGNFEDVTQGTPEYLAAHAAVFPFGRGIFAQFACRLMDATEDADKLFGWSLGTLGTRAQVVGCRPGFSPPHLFGARKWGFQTSSLLPPPLTGWGCFRGLEIARP